MEHVNTDTLAALTSIVGAESITTLPEKLASGSKDCYHFSPVLIPQLDGKSAEVIVYPNNHDELQKVLSLAAREKIPLVPRGAGTGNYGQGVPLNGGIMVNTRNLDNLLSLSTTSARVEAGHILYKIEAAAAQVDAELRLFPSTVPTSSSAGFIAGGSGGIGSIEWGMLWENDNILSATIYTLDDPSERVELVAGELEGVLHNCGLTAFISEVEFALAPRTSWHQYVIAFNDLKLALSAGEVLARDPDIRKRLITAFEWPIPSYFKPLRRGSAIPESKHVLFVYTDQPPEIIEGLSSALGGTVTFHQAPSQDGGRGRQLYDYTWNHTTQWAMKADHELTYLQDRFDINRLQDQIEERKKAFPGEVFEHIEFIRSKGDVQAGGLTIVKFTSPDRLNELIEFSEEIGISVANPHTYFLNDDGRWYGEGFHDKKQQYDRLGLLNPGHLRSASEK